MVGAAHMDRLGKQKMVELESAPELKKVTHIAHVLLKSKNAKSMFSNVFLLF